MNMETYKMKKTQLRNIVREELLKESNHDLIGEEVIPENDGITKEELDDLISIAKKNDVSEEFLIHLETMKLIYEKYINELNDNLVEYLNMCDEVNDEF